MTRLFPVLLLVCLASAGCRKKSSPEYYEAKSRYDVLLARDGDEAYTSEAMRLVVTALRAVPAQSLEGEQARTLAAKIEAEQARVAREAEAARAARDRAAVPLTAAPMGPAAPAPSVAPAVVETKPAPGLEQLTEAEVLKAFPTCMGPSHAVDTRGAIPGKTVGHDVIERPECQSLPGEHKPGVVATLIYADGRYRGLMSTTAAGEPKAAQPPAPPQEIDGGRFLLVPGAPLPPELGGPPPPTGKTDLPPGNAAVGGAPITTPAETQLPH